MTGEDTASAAPALQRIEDWPLRPWLLGGLLAACGFLLWLLLGDNGPTDLDHWRAAGAGFVFFGGIALALTFDLARWREVAAFCALIGAIMAGIAWQAVRTSDAIAGQDYVFWAGVIFTLLALPLFQAGFHRLRWQTDYRETHFHVWADAVSGAGALAFTGLSWLVLFLLDQLFQLVGIELIYQLMQQEWFGWTWSGGAFGASLGVLRNNLKVIGALQNVVMLVFALLAVPLALALLVFLLALAASGGTALWEATDAATPILLSCAAGAFILFNAVIRDTDEAKSGNRIQQIAAAVLAAGLLPLVLFAAISMGIRINQHGLSPERIWALIAIAVASAYGIAAWVALARGRRAGWSALLRQANLHLAVGVCALALILALPFWDFGAISARNQLARLESGRVSAKDFDYSALRWDFGDAGRAALAQLAASEGEVAELAAEAQAQEERVWGTPVPEAQLAQNVRYQFADPALREMVREWLKTRPWDCSEHCVVLHVDALPGGRQRFALVNTSGYYQTLDLPLDAPMCTGAAGEGPCIAQSVAAPVASQITAETPVQIREITRRFVVVDGKPVGEPLPEVEATPEPLEPAPPRR